MTGGVLCLVKNDDGIVKGAPSHEGQGGNLDGAGLHIFLQFHGGKHILQCVVKGLEIGVDLILHVAGEKTEFFACLHGRTRKDNLSALLIFQRAYGQGNRYVGLSRSGRTESESQVVFGKALHHLCLVGIARGYGLSVLPVDDHSLGIHLPGRFAAHDVDDCILSEFIIF